MFWPPIRRSLLAGHLVARVLVTQVLLTRVLVLGDHRFEPVVVIQEQRTGQRTIAAQVIFQEQRQGRSRCELSLGSKQPAPDQPSVGARR